MNDVQRGSSLPGLAMTGTDAPVVGVFDAGVGGIPLAALLDQRGYRVVYLGDAARRPYGPKPNDVVAGYVAEAERFFERAGCDAWVIACNTASVVAEGVLRRHIPCIDMVSAVVSAYPTTQSGKLGLLATAGTVASGTFDVALGTYDLHQIATEELLRLAEEGGGDAAVVRSLAAAALRSLAEAGCTEVVLACTDFTCVMGELQAEAGDLRLVDPLYEALRMVEALVPPPRGGEPPVHRLVLTGEHPLDVPAYARGRFGLELPEPEYRPLGTVSATAL